MRGLGARREELGTWELGAGRWELGAGNGGRLGSRSWGGRGLWGGDVVPECGAGVYEV